MIIKFENGYTVTVDDSNGVDSEKIVSEAKKAVDAVIKAKDAELTKVITPNVSFQITKLKEAYKNSDETAKNREVAYLMRDIEADLTHVNYPRAYTQAVLLNIIDKYVEAEKAIAPYDEPLAKSIGEKIDKLKELWGLEKEGTKDSYDDDEFDHPGRFSFDYDVWDDRKNDYVRFEESFFGEAYDEIEAEEKFKEYLRTKLKPTQTIKNKRFRWYDSKHLKDVPYYDPTDAPRIKSDYSPDRVSKEIAHSSEKGALLGELQEVFSEIDDFIARGRDVLTNAGWTRLDARHAINERYYAFINELEDAGHESIAAALREKVNKLEKVWDLKR